MNPALPEPRSWKDFSKSAYAADYIMHLIADGKLQAGNHVPQRQIAEVLGMSTVPVREALQMLEHDGWVTIEHQRGAFVNPITEEGVKAHYEISRIIQEHFIRVVFDLESPAVFAELEDIAKAIRETDSVSEGWYLLGKFNELTVAVMPNTQRARTLMRTIRGQSYYPGNTFEVIPKLMTLTQKTLAEVARAIRSNDVERAVNAVADLNRSTAREIIKYYRESGVIRIKHLQKASSP
jgi:DNA-binding GntR family transcriptional regulator